MAVSACASPAQIRQPESSPLATRVDIRLYRGDRPLHAGIRALPLLPGQELLLLGPEAAATADPERIVARAGGSGGPVRWSARRGRLAVEDTGPAGRVRYRAPALPGVDRITARSGDAPAPADEILVLVLVPWGPNAPRQLHGFHIGRYQPPPVSGAHARARRASVPGLVELTARERELLLTRHVRLGDLACKQQPGHEPAYLALDLRLLEKLERLRDRLVHTGWPAASLRIMSGYRTPHYNRAIGNRTPWSRHTLGDAADVYVDTDGDGRMDDIDGDGALSDADARALLALAEPLDDDPALIGGAAAYPATAAHGPFVHLDTRGYRARWSGFTSE